MTRADFKNRIKNMIGYSLACKDLEANPELIAGRDMNKLTSDCRKAFDILEDSLDIDDFVLDAIIGDMENNIYSKLYLNGKVAKEFTGLVFTDDEADIPDDAMEYVTCDEVRQICIDTTFDLADKIYEKVTMQDDVVGKMAV